MGLAITMNWLAALLDLVERIPPTFWGIVIGSFFSLGGVVLTNHANDRRLRAQLAHDRDLKNRDRELSLRKEVYLAAAEGIYAGIISTSKFANFDISHDKITETYLEKAPAIAKAQIIVQEATARALAHFSSEFGAVYLRLFAKRVPLGLQKQRLITLDQQIVNFANERDRMLELMKQHKLEGAIEQRRWQVIQSNFDFEQKRIAETTKQREALAGTLYVSQLEYTKECVSETTRLSRLLVPVLVPVRTELDLPINEAVYLQIIEEAIEKQESSFAEFLREARGFVAAQPGTAGDAR